MIGVHKLIDSHCEKFDGVKIAAEMAERQNTTPELILAEWKEKAERGTARGNALHDFAEASALNYMGRGPNPSDSLDTSNRLGQECLAISRFIGHMVKQESCLKSF